MIVAGVGAQKGVAPDSMVTAIQHALSRHGVTQHDLGLILTSMAKGGEPAIREAASQLSVPLMVVDDRRLQAAAPKCLTVSSHSIAATGLPSLSEAAAIVGAGLRACGTHASAG